MNKPPRLLITLPMLRDRAGDNLDMFDIVTVSGDAELAAAIEREGETFDAIYCAGIEDLGAARLARMPNVRLIVASAAGVGGIDADHAKAHGIAVTNAGGLNAGDVADYALALFLAHRRSVISNHLYVKEGRWASEGRLPLGRTIFGERAGIVGMGHIGQAIARRLVPFEVETRWWGPREKPDIETPRMESLEALARWSTVLFVAVRGDVTTEKLIDAPILNALGSDGLLVNVSRGYVVDEAALLSALEDDRLGGAALDVFENEPYDGRSLAGFPNVVLAPHVAGATVSSFGAVEHLAWENLRNFAAGEPVRMRIV